MVAPTAAASPTPPAPAPSTNGNQKDSAESDSDDDDFDDANAASPPPAPILARADGALGTAGEAIATFGTAAFATAGLWGLAGATRLLDAVESGEAGRALDAAFAQAKELGGRYLPTAAPAPAAASPAATWRRSPSAGAPRSCSPEERAACVSSFKLTPAYVDDDDGGPAGADGEVAVVASAGGGVGKGEGRLPASSLGEGAASDGSEQAELHSRLQSLLTRPASQPLL